MQDPIYAQLIQLSRNQMIINTLGHQLRTLRWIISGGSLESDDKFCDFIQLMIDDFDPKELCIGEFIIEARRRFPSLNLRQMIWSNIIFTNLHNNFEVKFLKKQLQWKILLPNTDLLRKYLSVE